VQEKVNAADKRSWEIRSAGRGPKEVRSHGITRVLIRSKCGRPHARNAGTQSSFSKGPEYLGAGRWRRLIAQPFDVHLNCELQRGAFKEGQHVRCEGGPTIRDGVSLRQILWRPRFRRAVNFS
jgi:hypothetical protein